MGLTYLTVLFLISVLTACTSCQKVNVSVYYEVLCPDSINFVRGPLFRAYEQVPDILSLELVPYGELFLSLSLFCR
jgi:hypothetical protein